jgi:cell division inhibitor SulA
MSSADTQQALAQVLRNPAIWRAESSSHGLHQQGVATAHTALDSALPEHGWPVGALTELLVKHTGAGELSLLTPALRAICKEGRGIALLAPPHLPQARAWQQAGIPLERLLIVEADGRDLLWSAEQVLRSGECGAVVVWGQAAGKALNHRALQRLHLAASTGKALCFLYRALNAQTEASPAPLRLRLVAQDDALHIHVVKCRGFTRTTPIALQLFPEHWEVNSKVNGKTDTKAERHGTMRSSRSLAVLMDGALKEGLLEEQVLKVASAPATLCVRVPTTA